MKKYLMLILCLFPLGVRAMAVSETFDVGDSVSVALYEGYETANKNGIGFHVIKESKAGEQYVTLIYDGVVEGSPTVYDENNPDENHEVSTVFETSVVAGKLATATQNWRGSISLLRQSDLDNLNITKNGSGYFEIPYKYGFLAPIKMDNSSLSPDKYNYWTAIAADSTSVYCVTYNETRESTGSWATLQPMNLTSITENSLCAIRPVVVIDKEYILCNNSKTPTTPTTGLENYLLPFSAIIILASAAVVITRKKNSFKQI